MEESSKARNRSVTLYFADPKLSQDLSLQAISVNDAVAKSALKKTDRFDTKTFIGGEDSFGSAFGLFLLEVYLLNRVIPRPLVFLEEEGKIRNYSVYRIWDGKLVGNGDVEMGHAYQKILNVSKNQPIKNLWLYQLFYKDQMIESGESLEQYRNNVEGCLRWIRNQIINLDSLPSSTKQKFNTSVFLGCLLFYRHSIEKGHPRYTVCYAQKPTEDFSVSVLFNSKNGTTRIPTDEEARELADRLYQVFPATERVHKELSLNHHPVTDKLSESSSEPITSKMGEDEVPYRVTEKRRLFPVLRRLYLTWWKIALAQSAVVLAVIWVTLQFVSLGNQKSTGSETEMPTLPPSKVEENSLGSEGRILELKDRHGEIAWRYTLPGKVQEYDFVDLDRDGVSEVLASVLGEDTRDGGWLLLFSLDGELIWERNLSALSIYSAKTGRLTVDYWKVGPVFRRDQLHVVVVGRDVSWALTSYLAVVDFEGNVVKRVWHPGNLHQILLAQESEDKLPLVFVRGINNHLSQPNPVDPVNPHNRCVFCLDFSVENVFQAPPYLGDGNNTIFKWYGLLFPTGPDVTKIEQADINGDGKQELGIWTLAGQVYYVSFDGEIVSIGQTDNPSGNSSFEFVDLKTGRLSAGN